MTDATAVRAARIEPIFSKDSPILLLHLPTELVVVILEWLPQAALRQVASVSRTLCDAARLAGLHIHRKVVLYASIVDGERQLGELNALIDSGIERTLRLWLSISLYPVYDSEGRSQSLVLSLLSAITRSLPRLVGLSLHFRGNILPDVYSALRDPAPLLRTLKIISDGGLPLGSASHIPLDIFSTVAPHLRTVGLRGSMIRPQLVPAFAHIRTLLVEYLERTTTVPLGPLFRRLSSIQVYRPDCEHNPVPLDVSSVELRTLVLRGSQPWEVSSLRNVRLDQLAEVHLVCHYTAWSGPLWERDLGDYAVHLRESERIRGWQISVIPAQRPYRFVYHVVQTIELGGIDRMPLAVQHLTSLRTDNICIHSVLKGTYMQLSGMQLSALREICIDMHSASRAPSLIWPPDYPHVFPQDSLQQHRSGPTFDGVANSFYYSIRCPALEKVSAFALDRPMTVHAPEIAFFGRSLSLLDAPEAKRPTLALVGVDFTEWTESHAALVGRVFSSVTKSAFVGASFDDYDHVHCVSAPGDRLSF